VKNFLDESGLEELPQLHSDRQAPLFIEAPRPLLLSRHEIFNFRM
jgi:hypothetical protein